MTRKDYTSRENKANNTVIGIAQITDLSGVSGTNLRLIDHINANGKTVWGLANPGGPDWAATKGYVDNRIQSGVGQTNASGKGTITYPVAYVSQPVVVMTSVAGLGFMVADGNPGLTSVAVSAYTHAGVALQTYFTWIAMPAGVIAQTLPAPEEEE